MLRNALRSPVLASALIALALFAVTLGGTFIYDDVSVVLRDPRLDAPIDWRAVWTGPYNRGVDNLYRPLVSATYAAQRWLHGDRPLPYHAVNWLLHAGVSALVAWVALRLSRRGGYDDRRAWGVAWIAGVLFAVHPIHVEAVAGVVGRAELMCAAGTLGAIGLCLGLRAPGRPTDAGVEAESAAPGTKRQATTPALQKARVAGALACFVVALLSKEQGLILPLVVGACCIGGRPGRLSPSAALLFVGFMVGVAAMVVWREQVIHLKLWWDRSFLDPWIQPLVDAGPRDRLLGPVAIAGRYLQLLVAPVTLRIDYGGPIVPTTTRLGDPYLWLGVAAIVAWLGLAAWSVLRRDRPLLAALLAFAVVYGMVGNVVTLIGVNVAERVMYLPSAFFAIAVASLASRLPRRVWTAGLIVVASLFAIRSFTYARKWNDRMGFYEYAVRVEPRSLKATLLAMQERIDRGDLDDAERLGRHAISLDPTYDDPYCRLGYVFLLRGDLAEAERLFSHAIDLNPAGRGHTFFQKLEEHRAATQPTSVR